MRVTRFINYITRQGDSFDSLALSVYNEEKMASNIIEYNPDHADVIIFEADVPLRIPIFDSVETPDTLPPWRRGS